MFLFVVHWSIKYAYLY